MQSQLKTVLAVLAIAAVAAPSSHAARLLRGSSSRFDQEDDPSGYSAYNAARVFSPLSSQTKTAYTPEAAESNAASSHSGVSRAAALGGGRLSYATVEANPWSDNPNRRKQTVQPRARSAIDLVGQAPRAPSLSSGSAQIPALVTNGAAVAQTYMGATAASLPEGIMLNQGKRRTTVAQSMRTAVPGTAPKASKAGSFATTAQGVTAIAASGAGNGKIVLAQADQAVAYAQSEKVDRFAPISRTSWQN